MAIRAPDGANKNENNQRNSKLNLPIIIEQFFWWDFDLFILSLIFPETFSRYQFHAFTSSKLVNSQINNIKKSKISKS